MRQKIKKNDSSHFFDRTPFSQLRGKYITRFTIDKILGKKKESRSWRFGFLDSKGDNL